MASLGWKGLKEKNKNTYIAYNTVKPDNSAPHSGN
jgi:hypothetical protein